MIHNLSCISSIDGRYYNYTKNLNHYFSEFSLFKYRLLIEITYLLYLKDIHLDELKDFTDNNCTIIKNIYQNFKLEDCIAIKKIEENINHDVKALEYFIQNKFDTFGIIFYFLFSNLCKIF